jgi:hypothetical protein
MLAVIFFKDKLTNETLMLEVVIVELNQVVRSS